MRSKREQLSVNLNPIFSVARDGTVLYSNEVSEPLLKEWGTGIGEKLPSSIMDIAQSVISRISPEKIEIKVGNKLYLFVFSPLPEEQRVSVSGFDISAQEESKERVLESEEKYSTLFNSIDEGFYLIDVIFDEDDNPVDMFYVESNAAANRMLGMDYTGKRLREIDPNYESYWYEIFGKVAKTGQSVRMEQYADPDKKWYSFYVFKIGGPDSRRIGNFFQDITKRKRAEEALRKSEERQAFLLKLSDALRTVEDVDQTLSIATRMLAEHLRASRVQYFLAEGDPEAKDACGVIKASYGREIPPMTGRYRMADFGIEPTDSMRAKITVVPNVFDDKKLSEEDIASYKAVSLGAWMSIPLIRQGRFVAALVIHQKEAKDWTPEEIELARETAERTWSAVERARAEEELKIAYNSLEKIETIRKKEIHHRIKNNLQVISSLLDLQAEKFNHKECIKDSEVLEAFKESQNRVISMALTHEELHRGGEIDTLNFSQYIVELADNLFLTYKFGSDGIVLDMDIEENIFFDMDTSIPLGIIVNELVSNSIKHAFSGREKGEIKIKLHREENKECIESISEDCKSTNFTLTISDNGVGIPEELDIENLDSLGFQLVISLVDQLDGEFELKRNNGTEFTMRFTVTERDDLAQVDLKSQECTD